MEHVDSTHRPAPRDSGAAHAQPGGAVLDSRDLFRLRDVVLIRHGGVDYRLRLTRQNKLILTK